MSRSPVYKNLALGIGSGVALAVGFSAVLRKRLRRAGEPSQAARATISNPTVFDHVLSNFETRLQEHLGEIQHRIAAVEARVELELNRLEAERLRFGRASQQSEQRVRDEVTAHVVDLEQRIQQTLADTNAKLAGLLVQTIETRVVDRIKTLEQSIAGQNDTIHTLRERSAGAEQNMQELVAGFGDAFHSALDHLQQPRIVDRHQEAKKWRVPLASGM